MMRVVVVSGVRGGGDGRHRGPHVLLHPAVHRAPDHVEKTRAHRPSNDGRQHRAQVSVPGQFRARAQLVVSQALADGVVARASEMNGTRVDVDEGAGVEGERQVFEGITRGFPSVR